MFGETSTLQPSWPLERSTREFFIEQLIGIFSKLFNRESRAYIERIVRAEENNAFLHSKSYRQYSQLLSELSRQAEKASNKSFENNSDGSVEPKKSQGGTSESMSGSLKTNKRDRNGKLLLSNPRTEQKSWKLDTGNLMLSPLHHNGSVESSGIMSTASSDCNSVVSLRNEERDKSGLNPTIYRTKSEMLGPSKRVLPSNPSLEVANSTQATFIALKNKYKIPFRFLKGVVPMIEDDTVCPKELKHRIQQFAHFLDLERDQFVELNIKPEVLMNLDTTMDTILHMFRPLLKEVVQWVETFGRSMFQMEPSYLSNHLSFSSEEKSSNSTADLLQTNPSNNQQSTWASEKEQVISILSSKSSRDGIVDSKQRVDPSKVENEESCISDELNKDKPPWNCQLQTAAITTIDYVKRFTKYMTQSNALKEERLRGQWEILKSLKSISDTGNQQFVHEELYENLKFACSSVERRYPHLHHELYYDAVIYIICKAKCTIIQLPLLFLFPSIENDGNVFFLIQNEACGGGELGESLITHFYEQIATQLTLTRNVSSILKIWGHITQSFMEMILKETRKST